MHETGLSFAERNGWIYPGSHQAKAVVDLLVSRARASKGQNKNKGTGKKCLSLLITAWKIETEGWTYEGEAVILANGSKASLVPGSDGSGYELAEKLGHKVYPSRSGTDWSEQQQEMFTKAGPVSVRKAKRLSL